MKIYDICLPKSILDLGLFHKEQIPLLTKVQNGLLAEQPTLIDCEYDTCPNCDQKLNKNGLLQSNFYAVFSDHKLRIQKHRCNNLECNWQSTPTTTTVFGTDIHPDLAKLQCEQETLFSCFHIAKKFENVKNALSEAFGESLNSVKWTVWHGEAQAVPTKLRLLQDNISDDAQRAKMQELHDYLKNNLTYLINYEERESSGRVYTSQAAELYIDTLINARHKRKRKMQWTREGARNVLQIRAKMVSQEWSEEWQHTVLDTIISAA